MTSAHPPPPYTAQMAATGESSRVLLALSWLVVGAAMVAVPVWLGWTRWEPILNAHPLMLALGLLLLLLGLVAVACSIAALVLGDRAHGEDRPRLTPGQQRRRAGRRLALGVPPLLVGLLAVGLLGWARPLPATAVALAAMRSADDVRVVDRLTWYEMTSVAQDSEGEVVRPVTGLVFSPGARVDSRAYAHVLRPLAKAGYLVVVLKEPLGIAFADPGHAERVMRVHPQIATWVVGGHSLGGVAASSFADAHPRVGGAPVAGLVLYASYPAGPLARADVTVLSVSGDLDRLTTPGDVAKARDELPPDTRYLVVPGAVHSDFGDYGRQPGDGTPTVDRAVAQAAIAKATARLLADVTPKPRKK